MGGRFSPAVSLKYTFLVNYGSNYAERNLVIGLTNLISTDDLSLP